MTEQEFFEYLLFKTDDAFNKSHQKDKGWFYSICGTPIQVNKGIIIGINWGVDNKHQHKRQSKMEIDEEIKNYKFIKNSSDFLINYLQINLEILDFNYSNLCFFRTPKENNLTFADYELSIPLFKEYVKFINPPWIFSFGITNFLRLLESKIIKKEQYKKHPDNNNKFYGVSGKLWDTNFYAVPHPNAHVPSEARLTIWKAISDEIKKYAQSKRPSS